MEGMEGYEASTYGDRFADVYDDWYPHPAGDAVATVADLAGGGAVLELGAGTGRLAIPLAATGCAVTGLDASVAMLERLAAKPGGDGVATVLGDMAGPLPDGPFAVVLVATNTLFNLTTDDAQRRCLTEVARVLAPGGTFVVEAFVPSPDTEARSEVEVRAIGADHVRLFVSRVEPDAQEAWSSFVDITADGIRLRPTHLRYRTPEQLDELAAEVGLVLVDRWGGWDRGPFGADSTHHVSTYRRGG